MGHHLSLPELSRPRPYHTPSPAESGTHHASLPLPCRCSWLVRFLKSFPSLPLSPSVSLHLRGNDGSVYQHSPPGHRGVGQRDWGVRRVLWLTVLIITVISSGWGKWEVSSCFLNATTAAPTGSLHSADTVHSERGAGRTEGWKSIGRREEG